MRAAGSLIVVMFIGSALLAQGRWYELYDEAIKHVQNGEWALAEQKLNSAKKLGPAPGRNRLRYGMLRTDFFPDFYLGIVYLNTIRPKESLAAFAIARKQALNLESNEFREIVTLEARAQQALKPQVAENVPPPPPGPVPTPTPARADRGSTTGVHPADTTRENGSGPRQLRRGRDRHRGRARHEARPGNDGHPARRSAAST